jgi:dipeptide/tripeptide permease
MQSSYYSIRFGGSLLGSLAGALVSNKATWGWGLTFSQVALINGAIPFVLVTPWLFKYVCVCVCVCVYVWMCGCVDVYV